MLPTKITQAAVGVLLLTGICLSCEKNSTSSSPEAEQRVAFTATIGAVESADGGPAAAFNANDIIAISGGGDFVDYIYKSDTWSATGEQELVWSAPTMTFNAYYPVEEGVSMSRFVLPQNQSDANSLTRANYMLAQSARVANDGTVVGLKFHHQLSQVVVRVKFKPGITGDDPVIRDVVIVSPHTEIIASLGSGEPVAVNPFREEAQLRYHAVLLPGTIDKEQVFVRIITDDGTEYTLKEVLELKKNRRYELELLAGEDSPELELASVTVGEWLDEQIVGTLRRYSFTLNGTTTYYKEGEILDLRADFIAGRKFTGWSAEPALSFENKPITQLIMPDNDLIVTAAYAEAPYKLIVLKPGLPADSRGGREVCPALVEQTDREYIRYYAAGDEVFLYDPTPSFVRWGSSGASAASILAAIAAGGGDKASSWLLMPQADAQISPVYESGEGKELLLHVAQSDYNTLNSGKILSDSEPKSIYYDSKQRKFDVKNPLQCRFDDDGKLHIRFYSAIGISNVKIRWNRNGQLLEFAHFDHIPPFFEARFDHPISLSGGTLVGVDGSEVACDRIVDLQQAGLELSISCDDVYWQKILTIIPSITLNFDSHGGDPDAPDGKPVVGTNWMGIRPVHIREACVMMTNMAYLFSTERFVQLINDHIDDLWGNGGPGDKIDAEELLRKYRANYNLSVGLVYTGQGVYGLATPTTYGISQGQFFAHYSGANIAWHEYGHVIGYQHSSSMTYGKFSEILCKEMYADMINQGQMPVSDRTVLNSLQNPTRYYAD